MFLSKHIAFSRHRRPSLPKMVVFVENAPPALLPLSIVNQRVYSPLHRMAEADRYIARIRHGED